MDSISRYCIPCSIKAKILICRTCPALDRDYTRTRKHKIAQRVAKRHVKKRVENIMDIFSTYRRLSIFGLRGKLTFSVDYTPHRRYAGGYAADRKRPALRHVHITSGWDEVDTRVAILHELAHIAVGVGAHHNAAWKAMFCCAVEQVLKRKLDPPFKNYEELDGYLCRAFRHYWKG